MIKKPFHKRSSTIIPIVVIMAVAFGIRTGHTYLQDPWVRQDVGNYLGNPTTETELLEASEKCNCEQLSIRMDRGTVAQYDEMIDSLSSCKVMWQRVLHFLLNRPNPYLTTLIPPMKYARAEMDHAGIISKIKVKLTGGQIDHFDTPRRSLRLKLKDRSVHGMDKFNLYNPSVRLGGIYEWAGHELLAYSGLLPLKTGYLDVAVNDGKRRIYFYQQQPTMQMLASNGKPPGLLIRIPHWTDEHGKNHVKISGYYDENSFPDKEQFEGQNSLLENRIIDYRSGLIDFDQLFSVPKLARYAAVIDLINGYHGSGFWNIYFYFNPTDSLLEPIGREFGTNHYEPMPLSNRPPYIVELASFRPYKTIDPDRFIYMDGQFSLGPKTGADFQNRYFEHLEKLSKPEYLDEFFEMVDQELLSRQYCLLKSNPDIKPFTKAHYYRNQELIRQYLEELGRN